jgi:Beta-propeller repeat
MMLPRRNTVLIAACVVLGVEPAPLRGDSSSLSRSEPIVIERGGSRPLRFEANAGQWDPRVRFAAHSTGSTLLITDDRFWVSAVAIHLVGAQPSTPRGEQELVTKSNFFLGSDPTRWRTNVPNYARVRATRWLSGVDVIWYGGATGLEYDLEVSAGVDARAIAFEIAGADSVAVTEDGSLEIATSEGALLQKPPLVVQGGRELPTRYVLAGDAHVRFAFEGYRLEEPLRIDPVLTYSTYLGGFGSDQGNGIAVDGSGSSYVAGTTQSTNLPTQGGVQSVNAGSFDVFVTKLNAGGSALVYSTYLGGLGADQANGIAVDSSGNAYVTGFTASTNFPTLNAFQSTNRATCTDCTTAFVAKLGPSGSVLAYSTYVGGSGGESAAQVAVDGSGDATIVGLTRSTDFPTSFALQSTNKGSGNAFVTKLDAAGSALAYSTYLGGTGSDSGKGIALDASGNAYITGVAGSTNFPVLGAFQPVTGGGNDAFVSKLSPSGSLLYSTYLGGSGTDAGTAIAVDTGGNAYVSGLTSSTNFPLHGAFQSANAAGSAGTAFVSKLGASGTALLYSTYLGGSGGDAAYGIAVDVGGNAFIAGDTSSTNFPTQSPVQSTYAGGGDAFVTLLGASGSVLAYSTYLGGSGQDTGAAIAVDTSGNAYVTGTTTSTNLPIETAFQSSYAGGGDAFVSKLGPALSQGAPCGASGECLSGNCADGECCDTACTAECAACDVSGHVGTCTPVTGAPHGSRAPCPTHGPCNATCDGTDTNQCTYGPAVCASTCAKGVETDSTCDTSGDCGSPTMHSCSNLVCASATSCQTTCVTDAECPIGFACIGGVCNPPTCVDDHTSKGPGGLVDCTPYMCTGGICGSSCVTTADCVAPSTCNANQCMQSSSGGCDMGTSGSPSGFLAVCLAALVSLWRRAREASRNRASSP